MNSIKKKKASAIKNAYILVLIFLGTIVGFLVGCMFMFHRSNAMSTEIDWTNFYTNKTHYIVFRSEGGGITTVNYTLDSMMKVNAEMKLEAPMYEIKPLPDGLKK